MGWHHSTHWGPKCNKKVKEEWILFISSWAGMSISSCLQIWEILVLGPLDSRIYTSGPWFSYPTGFPSSAASRLQTVGLLNLQNRMSQCPLSSSYMSVYPRLVLFLWTTLADTGTSQSRQQRAWAWLQPRDGNTSLLFVPGPCTLPCNSLFIKLRKWLLLSLSVFTIICVLLGSWLMILRFIEWTNEWGCTVVSHTSE